MIFREVRARLDRRDVQGARALVVAAPRPLARDAALALMELSRHLPRDRDLAAEIAPVAHAFGGDVEIATAACAALLAAEDAHPKDEERGPQSFAADARLLAARALESEDDARLHAQRGNACRFLGRDFDDEARSSFARAIALEPDSAAHRHDLGLFYKWRGRFAEAREAFERARERIGDTPHLLVNLATVCTALGDGAAAAACHRALGLPCEVNRAGMPVVPGLPSARVRVAAKGAGIGSSDRAVPDRALGFELVSVSPISPCHGVVDSATYRDTAIDYGDVVLWDPEPSDVRAEDGVAVPRFPLLACLVPGEERRFRFVALAQRDGDVAALQATLPEGCLVFVHVERVEYACAHCASGDAFKKHTHEEAEHRVVYGKMVVPKDVPLPSVASAVEGAIRAHGRVSLSVPALYEALGDTRRAGKEHTAWLGVERAASRARA